MRQFRHCQPLPREFYCLDTLIVAQNLLGKILIRQTPKGTMMARIVEVEAYKGTEDAASYAFKGRTPKSSMMFKPGGLAFIVRVRGSYYTFNITTEKHNIPGAVLIRAVEPLKGINLMRKNRLVKQLKRLTNGPAKLTQAFGISVRHNGLDLTKSRELSICASVTKKISYTLVISRPRVGIKSATEKMWRFYIKNNPFISLKSES
jgi:DNA-3-methyladenine glycosylase